MTWFEGAFAAIGGFFLDVFLDILVAAGVDAVLVSDAVAYGAKWNGVMPLSALFGIGVTTWSVRMTIRFIRFALGLIPTVHG